MKRVPRADVALSVDWSAVRNRPVIPEASTKTTVVERIIQQLPSPVPGSKPIYVSWNFDWDPGTILPLQTVAHDKTILSAMPGCPCVVGSPSAMFFGQLSAQVVELQTVRIFLTNLSLAPIAPGLASWKLLVFFV